MTRIDKARQYMAEARGLHQEIKSLQMTMARERERMEFYSRYCKKDMTKCPGFMEFMKAIQDQIARFEATLEDREQIIDSIADERYKIVLRSRYIEAMKLEKAADQAYYSMHHFSRLQSHALEAVADQLGLEDDPQ